MKIGPILKAEIESTFSVVPSRSTANELVFVCPEPGCGDQSGNRSVNLLTGKTNCWRCNKASNNFVAWARHLGFAFSNDENVGVATDFEPLEVRRLRTHLPPVRPVKLPDGFQYIADFPDSVYTRYIGEMAERKNLTLDDFVRANVGFTRVGRWSDYAIFPVVEYGTAVYYQGRTYAENPGQRTKKFPSNDEVEYGAKYWVYGIDEARVRTTQIVLVVESILNVLSLRAQFATLNWTNVVPVCVFKHSISQPQWLKLTQIPHLEEICILFDHDATRSVWAMGNRLSSRASLTVAEMPAGPNNEKYDPNDDVEAAIDAFLARKPYRFTEAVGAELAAPRPSQSLAGRRIGS